MLKWKSHTTQDVCTCLLLPSPLLQQMCLHHISVLFNTEIPYLIAFCIRSWSKSWCWRWTKNQAWKLWRNHFIRFQTQKFSLKTEDCGDTKCDYGKCFFPFPFFLCPFDVKLEKVWLPPLSSEAKCFIFIREKKS